jgi:large-conductance mechanosensitive channel
MIFWDSFDERGCVKFSHCCYGGAFKIINSCCLLLCQLLVGVDFTQNSLLDGGHYDTLDAAKEVGTAVITYGNLLQATINYYCIVCFL